MFTSLKIQHFGFGRTERVQSFHAAQAVERVHRRGVWGSIVLRCDSVAMRNMCEHA
jgi:hypothetical protein